MNSLYLKVLKVDSSEAVINKFYDTLIDTNTRKNRHYVPLSFYVMNLFLKNGFVLKEDIIKVQHNCKSTPYWERQVEKYNFFLIMHKHLFVFRKPKKR